MKLYSIIIDKQTNKQKFSTSITQTGLISEKTKMNTTYAKENEKIIHLNLLLNENTTISDKKVFDKMLKKDDWHEFE